MSTIDNVIDQARIKQIRAFAGQTAFDYPFPIFASADLVVNINGAVVAPTGYSVTGVADDNGGTVNLAVAAAADDLVTIYADTAIERLTDYQFLGRFDSERFNNELDRMTINHQELRDQIRRTVRLGLAGEVSAPEDVELPQLVSQRAGGILSFDQDGRIALVSVSLTNNAVTALWQMSGNGVTTVFAIPGGTSNTAAIYFVTLNGVRQTPTVDYTVADEQITFTTPPGPEIESILVQVVGSGAEGQKGEPGSSAVFVSPTPPDDPFVGMLWLS